MSSLRHRFPRRPLAITRRQFTRPLRLERLEERTVLAGEPILVVTAEANPFSEYYTEILRAEGLNAFATSDIGTVTPAALAERDVVVLGEMPLTTSQVAMFSDWVTAGGNLIAMRPDKQLSGLLGLNDASATLSNAYLQVNTSSGPGAGIVGETIQFHGTADRYTLAGASSIATLYASGTTSTTSPAVTLRSIGNSGGQAAAFTYDLARSVVYTRQGNPAWSGQNRDGNGPIRSNDLFYGNASFDPQPDWVDLNKVSIPQADEQQRLLANLVLEMNLDNLPLPRFWYLPRGEKAAVVMTGDDHGAGGTDGQFNSFIAASPQGSSAADWSAVRGTSYIFPNTPLSQAAAAAYTAQGFEIALHVTTNAQDWTPAQLNDFYTNQLAQFQAAYPGLPTPVTNRTHAIVWSDYATQPKIELQHGIRFDTNYYYFPADWIQNRPGMFTGSGMPMRFADTDGTLIDVYQAATQMTDESGQGYPFTVNALLDAALDSRGYYGVFTANMHTDHDHHSGADAIVASARARDVPVVSARQMLEWLDGRNASSFGSLSWNSAQSSLSFAITPGANANGLEGMVPVRSAAGVLINLARNGTPVAYATKVIKGVAYAFFPGSAGNYAATYGPDSTAPTVTARTPESGATGVSTTDPGITATFSESVHPGTISFVLRDSAGNPVAGSSAFDDSTNTVTFTPSAPLSLGTTFTVTLGGAQDHAGNSIAASSWSFTTTSAVINATVWPSTAVPAVASSGDPAANELGVKFRSDMAGYITGIRFYKGAANTGTHVGHLWTGSGTPLATATFTNETPTGWQQVDFAQPVQIQANTTYVASYFAPNGNYSFNGAYFASGGVDSGVLHALSNSEAAGNGVFLAGASGFPTSSFNSGNYWVDVVFSSTLVPAITNKTPAHGATGVNVGAAITATFHRPVDPATVNSSTFRLRAVGATADVPATVSYAGLTATLQPNAPLLVSKTYQVTVSGSMAGTDGTPIGADTTWSFTTQPFLTFADTTAADFGAGTVDGGAAILQTGDGEAALKPAAGAEFSGTALPSDWTSTVNSSGGAATVAGGRMTADGALANSTAQFTPGRSLEFVATFSGDGFQHAGFADGFGTALWAMFSTGSGGGLFARTAGPGGSIDTPLAAGLLGGSHRFRIDWTATGVTYFVDGTQVAAHNLAVSSSMRPTVSDFNTGGGVVTVDWMRLTPYASSGTFLSRVLDAGSSSAWIDASWTAAQPPGTSLAISVRTGNTATPDATWTDFVPLTSSGAAIGAVARYLQYRANLATTSPDQTPALQSVTIQYAPNSVPVANSDVFTTSEDATLAAQAPGVLGNDTDDDGNPLTAILVSGPAHGTLTLTANGSFIYTPAANYNGPDSFTYKANDGRADSGVATVSLTVTPVNDSPVAAGDSGSTAEDAPLTVPAPGVLGNDSDLDSTALTAVLVAGPSHGTLTLNSNGSFTYTPVANYNGPDSFTYKVNDGSLDSNVATVSLTVTAVNDAPVAASDSYTVAEDTPLEVALPGVLGNDTDVDGDALSVVSFVTAPAHGTLVLGSNGAISYMPATNYNGPDSFTYKITDGALESNVATVSITVTAVNDAPVAINNTWSTVEEVAINFPAPGILGNDTDVDGDSLTAILVTAPAHGTLTLTASGSASYTPAAAYFGPDSFTYQARDPSGALSNVATVSITVSPPTLSISNVTANEGGLLGSTPFTFVVSLSSATSRTIDVNYATANGTATAGISLLGGDYNSTSGTLTFQGQLTRTVVVTVHGDLTTEPNETFFVNLSSATTPIADNQGLGTIQNDDSGFLHVAGGEVVGASEPALTSDSLDPIVAEAIARWAAAGTDESALALLRTLDVQIVDLPGSAVGATTTDAIWIDTNAAGHGWFVDPTPSDDIEFILRGNQGERRRVDLLTVVMHEMGHALGLEHGDERLMHEELAPGVRHQRTVANLSEMIVWLPISDSADEAEIVGILPRGELTSTAKQSARSTRRIDHSTAAGIPFVVTGGLRKVAPIPDPPLEALDRLFATLGEEDDELDLGEST